MSFSPRVAAEIARLCAIPTCATNASTCRPPAGAVTTILINRVCRREIPTEVSGPTPTAQMKRPAAAEANGRSSRNFLPTVPGTDAYAAPSTAPTTAPSRSGMDRRTVGTVRSMVGSKYA